MESCPREWALAFAYYHYPTFPLCALPEAGVKALVEPSRFGLDAAEETWYYLCIHSWGTRKWKATRRFLKSGTRHNRQHQVSVNSEPLQGRFVSHSHSRAPYYSHIQSVLQYVHKFFHTHVP